ncbi:MAG: hypothetical protein VX589_17145 [Myxococcota bacterium]|nr:hypothetical protein [Myxococcota bacterium]
MKTKSQKRRVHAATFVKLSRASDLSSGGELGARAAQREMGQGRHGVRTAPSPTSIAPVQAMRRPQVQRWSPMMELAASLALIAISLVAGSYAAVSAL